MKDKILYGLIGVGLAALAWVLPSSGGMSSSSYEVPVHVLDNAGAESASAGYLNIGALGQSTPIGFSQSTNFHIRAGYIAQLASLQGCWDQDGDRFLDEACGGDDCDDTDFDINPGAQEGPPQEPTCTDGIDNDCDDLIDLEDEADCLCWDDDGDGYSDCACSPPPCDCDDADTDMNPGAIEDCDNGIDDDCDDLLDWYDLEDCYEFILELDAEYLYGYLTLNYRIATIEAATWANYLILTLPSVQVIKLWSLSLPKIYPPIGIPISFPLPSLGLIGIYTGLFTAGGLEEFDLVWVDT